MKKFILFIIAIIILGGLYLISQRGGSTEMTVDETSTQIVNDITSHTWVWEKTLMNDGSTIVPNKTDRFTLTFGTDGNVSGTTDCNGFFGSYELGADGMITFSEFGSTMMYCEGSQEMVFTRYIADSTQYMFDTNKNLILLIKYDSGSVLFKKQ